MPHNDSLREPVRLLMVEQKADTLMMIADLLTDHGWEVSRVTRDHLSPASQQSLPWAIAFVEMSLLRETRGGMLDLVRYWCNDPEIIVVTQIVFLKEILWCVQIGVTEYLRPPIENLPSFMTRLHELVVVWEEHHRTPVEQYSETVLTRKVTSWITLHFAQPKVITWHQMRGKFQRGRNRLGTLMRQGTGMSKQQIVQNLRREVLRIALRECDEILVKQIGAAIGLKQEWSLTRVCRQLLGVSPQEYRAVMKRSRKLYTMQEVIEQARRFLAQKQNR